MDHREVARNGLEEYLTGLKATVDGLTPVELYWQPSPASNHIAWLVWHMARVEDNWYNRYIGQNEPVWTADEFCTRFRLTAERGGYGDTAEDVAETMMSLITGNRFVTGQVIVVDGGYSSTT